MARRTPERAQEPRNDAAGSNPAPGGVGARTAPLTVRLTFPIPEPLLTINWRRRHHWRTQARETKAQRAETCLRMRTGLALDEDALPIYPSYPGRVRVDVAVYPRKGMQRHDDSAIWEALKPLFDGLEDFGIVANDRQFVHGSLTWEAERSGRFVLTLRPDEEQRAA